MNRPLLLLPVLLFAAVVGCSGSDAPKYTKIKGTVKYNGKPIDKGTVTFAVEGRPPSTMDIVDGEFTGQAMIGTNKVSVSARKKSASGPRLDQHAKTQIKGYAEIKFKREQGTFDYDMSMVDYIPPEWGSQSTHTMVVEAGGQNDFPINIKGN
jgi:hypothetical protein